LPAPVAISTISRPAQDRPHAHRERLTRHVRGPAAEQVRVGSPRAAASFARCVLAFTDSRRLVEPDVPVRADAEDQQVEPAALRMAAS
jgi:hypothetical protein